MRFVKKFIPPDFDLLLEGSVWDNADNHDDNNNDFDGDDDDDDDVEDLDLLLEGSVWDDADVENAEETVDVTLAVRH